MFNTVAQAQAQETTTKWLWTYNNERLNMVIGGITPGMKLRQYNALNPST